MESIWNHYDDIYYTKKGDNRVNKLKFDLIIFFRKSDSEKVKPIVKRIFKNDN
jgi:hypothetical protein